MGIKSRKQRWLVGFSLASMIVLSACTSPDDEKTMSSDDEAYIGDEPTSQMVPRVSSAYLLKRFEDTCEKYEGRNDPAISQLLSEGYLEREGLRGSPWEKILFHPDGKPTVAFSTVRASVTEGDLTINTCLILTPKDANLADAVENHISRKPGVKPARTTADARARGARKGWYVGSARTTKSYFSYEGEDRQLGEFYVIGVGFFIG